MVYLRVHIFKAVLSQLMIHSSKAELVPSYEYAYHDDTRKGSPARATHVAAREREKRLVFSDYNTPNIFLSFRTSCQSSLVNSSR